LRNIARLTAEGGCFTNLSGTLYFSFAHTEEDLRRIVSVTDSVLDKYNFGEASAL